MSTTAGLETRIVAGAAKLVEDGPCATGSIALVRIVHLKKAGRKLSLQVDAVDKKISEMQVGLSTPSTAPSISTRRPPSTIYALSTIYQHLHRRR